MMEWRDPKKERPENNQLCVVFDPTNYPTVWPAKYDASNDSFSSNGGWFEPEEITHWMPLPEPPKE